MVYNFCSSRQLLSMLNFFQIKEILYVADCPLFVFEGTQVTYQRSIKSYCR